MILIQKIKQNYGKLFQKLSIYYYKLKQKSYEKIIYFIIWITHYP